MSTAEEVGRTGDDFHKNPLVISVLMFLDSDVQFKAVGNKALQAGDFDGAIEAYTKVRLALTGQKARYGPGAE